MIVASHQPNFLPYMGYFYKMYMCDVFTLSDTVLFSNSGYHNYNFILERNGEIAKITVPVSDRSKPINQVRLSGWEHHRKKIWLRLKQTYSKAPHFKELEPVFREIFMDDYQYLSELNERLIMTIHGLFGMDCLVIRESDLGVTGDTPTQQIADICDRTMCKTYLSGTGAMEYLDAALLAEKGLRVEWSRYEPSTPSEALCLSVFDYLMYKGTNIPPDWEADKEALRNG